MALHFVNVFLAACLIATPLTAATVTDSSVSNVHSVTSVLVDVTGTVSSAGGCEAPSIPNSNIRDEVAGNYSVSSVVEVVCHPGYRFPHIKSTVLQFVCKPDGTWTDVLGIENVPACELIGGCPTPNIANGTLSHVGGFMPGDAAIIHCNKHFVLMPSNAKSVIICNKDGSWSSGETAFPTCQVASSIRCPWPSKVENGNFKIVDDDGSGVVNDTVGSGVHVWYFCNDGYRMLPNNSPVMECREGSWNAQPPTCQPRQADQRCSRPPDVTHARYYIVNGSRDHNWSFLTGAKIVYVCDTGYHPECSSCLLTSTCVEGDWNGHGPNCVPDLGCVIPPPSVPHASYTLSRREESNGISYTASTRVPDGVHVLYYCNSGYHMLNNNATVVCRNGEWLGQTPSCVKRTGCDMPMNIENGNWIIQSLLADFRFGVHVTYECEPGYKAIGATDITCLASGYWSDYPPKCLPKDEYCSEPLPVRDGFFMCKPSQCDSFHVGTELHYVCNKNYRLSPGDRSFVQICQPGGQWSEEPPVCIPDFVVGVTHSSNLTTNTVTVVVSSSCAVLGLLVLVMLAVAVQRRLKPHSSSRLCPPSLPGSSAQSLPGSSVPYPAPRRDGDEHDRLALIAFADDIRGVGLPAPPLPSYEQAIRSTPHVYHGFTHFADGGNSRTSSGRSSRSGEYRPLPSIRLMRDTALPVASPSSGDPRRNSIITNASNNLSVAAFGSMDTVNAAASDATSTSVTVDTYDSMASNPSIVASQRAIAGSIESSSMHSSLASDAAPLLDQQQQREATGYDTLRSQSSRGTQSDSASRIVEVTEENKLD